MCCGCVQVEVHLKLQLLLRIKMLFYSVKYPYLNILRLLQTYILADDM